MYLLNKSLVLIIAASLFISLSAFGSLRPEATPDTAFVAPSAKWEKLGSRKVNYRLERDVIPVTLAERTFTKLKIAVTGGAINMHKMVVTYGNGETQEITLCHKFRRGSSSRVIDLQGRRRIIRSINVWYDTRNLARKRAAFHVFGRH